MLLCPSPSLPWCSKDNLLEDMGKVSSGSHGVMLSFVAAGASVVVGYGLYRFLKARSAAQKAKQILEEMTKSLDKPNVYIRDIVGVRDKLRKLWAGGPDNLQVLCDFDKTMSKFMLENGVKGDSVFGVLENCEKFPESYRKKTTELREHYLPIEFSSDLSDVEKAPLMQEWWGKANDLLIELGVKKTDLPDIVRGANIALRDGADYFFVKLHEKNVPLLILSAGITDVIHEVISQQSELYQNVEVAANEFEYNAEEVMVGFKGNRMIMSGNKKEMTKDLEFFQKNKDRPNVLLVGDHTADVQMAGNVKNPETILKIGFLNEKVDERMDAYKETFDVVIVDDHSIEIVDLLLMKILHL